MLTKQLHRQLLVFSKLCQTALNTVFAEKDIEESCVIFLELMSVTVLEENSQANSSNLRVIETSIECNNFNINSCLSSFENLKESQFS